jgi:hypothetical protein
MTGPQRTPASWYPAFYAACIVGMSILTMVDAQSLSDHRAWLPALEIIGAILLIMRRTTIAGVVILLAVYAFAAIHDLHSGHIPLHLVLFAGTAVLIAQLRSRPSPGADV